MQIILSRRNLLTLLAKLELSRTQPCIIKPDGCVVVAEADEVHYAGRKPGVCSDETQAIIDEIEACLARRRRLEAIDTSFYMEPMKSAAEIMRDASVPNMLEGRELRLQLWDVCYQRAMERSAEIKAKLNDDSAENA